MSPGTYCDLAGVFSQPEIVPTTGIGCHPTTTDLLSSGRTHRRNVAPHSSRASATRDVHFPTQADVPLPPFQAKHLTGATANGYVMSVLNDPTPAIEVNTDLVDGTPLPPDTTQATTVTVRNNTNSEQTVTVQFTRDGAAPTTQMVTIPAAGTADVPFEWTTPPTEDSLTFLLNILARTDGQVQDQTTVTLVAGTEEAFTADRELDLSRLGAGLGLLGLGWWWWRD